MELPRGKMSERWAAAKAASEEKWQKIDGGVNFANLVGALSVTRPSRKEAFALTHHA
jgi:hypothetical protein